MREPSARRRRLFFAIFTISGFSGLIYEAIWSHYLKLFLGHAAYAQTLVLAIFMGGMALGSWIMAKYSHRIANLLMGYAFVEGVIGLLGLVFHRTSTGLMSWAFESVLPNIDSVAGAQLLKWSLGALLILPQSVLLGMTFPLMSGATVRRFPERSGETLAMLYFTNSLGAALGVLVSGFVLISAVGLPGTILTAGLLNVALALFVWGIVKYQPDSVRAAPAPTPSAEGLSQPRLLRWMLIGAATTGAASFLYEIAWIRMLSLVLGSSTHSFEMMLSAFILGIALGGLWVHRRIDSMKDPVKFLSTILFVMAGVALLSLPVYNATFNLMSQAMQAFSPTEQGYVGVSVSSHVLAMLVMIPTTFFCGMTLPIMTQVLIRGGIGERAIGAVYAWNTAGAIAGVILAVHVLMPLIGLKGIVIAGAALQLFLAVVYRSQSASATDRVKARFAPALACTAVLVAAALFLTLDPAKLSSGVFRHGRASNADRSKVLLLEHGKTATISLTKAMGIVIIATNGKPDAAIEMEDGPATTDEITMILIGAMPVALHPNPRKVANIGFGSGLTSHVLLASPSVEEVDTIEIEPVMAKAAELGFKSRVFRTFSDPRSHIHFEDAKTFFAMHHKKYDVIVSEPSNPWVSGVSTLFSREFYQQITRYLEPDGMLIQWIQTYEADMDIVLSVVKALAPEFADFAIYSTDDTDVLIVAVRSGTLPRPDSRPFASQEMRNELARVGIVTVQDIESRFLGNRKLLTPLVMESGVPANSDYFPYVDLHAARARILKLNAIEFTGLQTLPVPFFELLEGVAHQRASTTPSSNPMSGRDSMGAAAVELRRAVMTSQYDGLEPDATRLLLTLHSSIDDCAKPAIRRAWLASAHYVAAQTSAPLSAKELQPMWDTIEKTPCAEMLAPQDREMLSLLRAVALREVAKVAATGSGLFAGNYDFAEPAQMSFALLATAASAVGTNRPGTAIDVIQANAGRISHTPTLTLAIKWLAAIALAQSQTAPRSTGLAKDLAPDQRVSQNRRN